MEPEPETQDCFLRLTQNQISNRVAHFTVTPPEHILPPSVAVSDGGMPSLHVVFVVDVSGSMQANVESVGSGGEKENHGFCILDLVKHSLLTIVNSLSEEHIVSIVSFTDVAKLELDAERMGTDGKKSATEAIEKLTPLNSTNLWKGLKLGLDSVKKVAQVMSGVRNEIMVFTDGMPNCPPPRGDHVTELQRYQQDMPEHTIRTYGFGYSLDSKLLEEIATVGNANFSFIPDAGFVGTIFIHAVADILTTCPVKDLRLVLEVDLANMANQDNESKTNDFLGLDRFCMKKQHPEDPDVGIIECPLSNIGYGQAKDIVIEKPAFRKAYVRYFDCIANRTVSIEAGTCLEPEPAIEGAAGDEKALETHLLRSRACKIIHDSLDTGLGFGKEKQYGRATVEKAKIDEGREKLALFIEQCENSSVLADPNNTNNTNESNNEWANLGGAGGAGRNPNALKDGILQDLKGQLSEAFSKEDWFRRWGEYYSRSIVFAHIHQRRNNFKDVGVQFYGGKAFEDEVDRINEIFDNLPAPKPTARTSHAVCRSAPINMAAYNNSYGVCFAPGVKVMVAPENGVAPARAGWKNVEELKKGDKVCNAVVDEIGMFTGEMITAEIDIVVKTLGPVQILESGVTPYHPILIDGEREWTYPCESGLSSCDKLMNTPCMYNFVLKEDSKQHTMFIELLNGEKVRTCTLGHGMTSDEVIEHEVFGNMQVVKGILEKVCIQKGQKTALQGGEVVLGPEHAGIWEAPSKASKATEKKVGVEEKPENLAMALRCC